MEFANYLDTNVSYP